MFAFYIIMCYTVFIQQHMERRRFMNTNPLIFHIDVNSAYLSWTAVHELELGRTEDIRLVPSAIGGNREIRHGVILAKSPSAKACGIRTGEPVVTALKKCPSLQLFPPDFELYDKNSRAFLSILRTYSPHVEPFSIDEAFMDMSGTELLYGSSLNAAKQIRDQIFSELGFTVNIGIAENRLLAKMASDFEKPGKIHTLFPPEIRTKMWPLPVTDLFMVGRSAAETLHALGIHTIGELASSNPATLRAHLKKQGEILWKYANGQDDGLFDRDTKDREIGNSTTLPDDIDSSDAAKKILLALCETVCTRLRHQNLRAACVSVQITDCNFVRRSHQKALPVLTNITGELYSAVCALFDELWNGTPIRLLGVQTSKTASESYRQFSLFDSGKAEKLEKLDSCVDEIRKKFGDDSIKRASFLNGQTRHMIGKQTGAKKHD